jgi:hypothetical protein
MLPETRFLGNYCSQLSPLLQREIIIKGVCEQAAENI